MLSFPKTIRAVYGSLGGGADDVDNVYRVGNLGKQFAVDAIDDFFNVKVIVCDTAS